MVDLIMNDILLNQCTILNYNNEPRKSKTDRKKPDVKLTLLYDLH